MDDKNAPPIFPLKHKKEDATVCEWPEPHETTQGCATIQDAKATVEPETCHAGATTTATQQEPPGPINYAQQVYDDIWNTSQANLLPYYVEGAVRVSNMKPRVMVPVGTRYEQTGAAIAAAYYDLCAPTRTETLISPSSGRDVSLVRADYCSKDTFELHCTAVLQNRARQDEADWPKDKCIRKALDNDAETCEFRKRQRRY